MRCSSEGSLPFIYVQPKRMAGPQKKSSMAEFGFYGTFSKATPKRSKRPQSRFETVSLTNQLKHFPLWGTCFSWFDCFASICGNMIECPQSSLSFGRRPPASPIPFQQSSQTTTARTLRRSMFRSRRKWRLPGPESPMGRSRSPSNRPSSQRPMRQRK